MVSHTGLPYARTLASAFSVAARAQPIARPWNHVHQGPVLAGFEPRVDPFDQPQRPSPCISAHWFDPVLIWLIDAVLSVGVTGIFLEFAASQMKRRVRDYIAGIRYRRPPTVAS
jgi:hypothetical protein